MYEKRYCEEIIENNKIKIIISNKIDLLCSNFFFKSNDVKVPIVYIDSNVYPLLSETNLKYWIIRLHDSINNQTFYIITCDKTMEIDYSYDKHFIQFINSLSNLPQYEYTQFMCLNVNVKYKDIIDSEIIFNIESDEIISREYQMNRDYRISLDFLNNVSLLSSYKDELYDNNQEIMS